MTIIVERHVATDGMTGTMACMTRATIILVMVGQLSIVDDIVGQALVRRPVPVVVREVVVSMGTRIGKIMGIGICRQLEKKFSC
jgi:hypothetical protein